MNDATSLMCAIMAKFPSDSGEDIQSWYDSAKEYGQPLTVEEYGEWRRYDEVGKLKPNMK